MSVKNLQKQVDELKGQLETKKDEIVQLKNIGGNLNDIINDELELQSKTTQPAESTTHLVESKDGALTLDQIESLNNEIKILKDTLQNQIKSHQLEVSQLKSAVDR